MKELEGSHVNWMKKIGVCLLTGMLSITQVSFPIASKALENSSEYIEKNDEKNIQNTEDNTIGFEEEESRYEGSTPLNESSVQKETLSFVIDENNVLPELFTNLFLIKKTLTIFR